MESPTASEPNASDRRRSGRVTRRPDHLDNYEIARHGRAQYQEDESDASDDDENEEDDDDDGAEEEDEEEMKAQGKRSKKQAPTRGRPAKKLRENGDGTALAIRPAKKPRVKRAVRFSALDNATGLYAQVFGRGERLDDITAEWIAEYKKSPKEAVASLFSFIIRCTGCDKEVDVDVIEDSDSFASRIDDFQQEYQAQNVTEYPLISRSKGTAAFKSTFTGVIRSLILTLAKSNLLYDDAPLMENIGAWLTPMSATQNRPFRHTATVASLTILSTLCEVGSELEDNKSKLTRQIQAEKKKSRNSNKSRVTEMEGNLEENAEREKTIKESMEGWFDTVFIHRYRDVDPHIRLDCMNALTEWVITLPVVFLDGSYTRYFGWTLSDLNSSARQEVLKGLIKLYKDSAKLNAMTTFTERFRPRIVEMATRDSDYQVRVLAIELIEIFKEAGYLEGEDIDSIGKLIFDSDIRIRKAVVNFFAQNIDDTYNDAIEELGGLESLQETLGQRNEDDEDYSSPSLDWIKIKSVIENLAAYDASDDVETSGQIPNGDSYLLTQVTESRFTISAEGLVEAIPQLNWQIVAGYLLFDHSPAPSGKKKSRSSTDVLTTFKNRVRPTDKEELLLLEVLNVSAKVEQSDLIHDKTIKLSKAQKVEEKAKLEEGSKLLAALIPQLLKKFGAIPEAASIILRLEHVIRPEAQDATAYISLLEDVKKQFQSHVKPEVLKEASRALLHGRAGDAEESAQAKITSLITDTIDRITTIAKSNIPDERGNLDREELEILLGAVFRLEMLGGIEDISTVLETAPPEPKKKVSSLPTPFETIILILARGEIDRYDPSDLAPLEDELAIHAAKTISFYFLWTIQKITQALKTSGTVSPTTITAIQKRKKQYVDTLIALIDNRNGAEEIRLSLAISLVDIHVAFAGLANVKYAKRDNQGTQNGQRPAYLSLVTEIPKAAQNTLLQVLSAAEKVYAKRTKRNLEDPAAIIAAAAAAAIDAEPEDDEPATDEDEDDDDQDGEGLTGDAKLAADLLAERRLCDVAGTLVLGVWAAVLDGKKEMNGREMIRKRLRRNKNKLGPNFKACVDALDKGGPLSSGRKKGTIATDAKGKKVVSKAIIVDDDDEDDEDHQDAVGGAAMDEDGREDTPEREERDKTPESVMGD